MAGIVCYNSNGTPLKRLTQWDINQTITVTGIDVNPIPEFHFCNSCSEFAYVVAATIDGGRLSVPVPNILLQQHLPIVLYAYYVYDDGSAKTGDTIVINVVPRPKPAEYVYEDNTEYNSWAELVSEAQQLLIDLDDALTWIEF